MPCHASYIYFDLGEKRLIHHLVPRVAGVDWSASWSCKADWLSMDEMATLQDTEEFTK